MKLEINVPVSGLDLATLLEGEQGLFLSQNRGQNYITVAKPGHPIAFGPMPRVKRFRTRPQIWGPSRGSSPKLATRLISLTLVAVLEENPKKIVETIACKPSQ